MKKFKNFIVGAGMFATLGIIAKLIGVFYRLPLTNLLGAEGMGLYQMIFPLYSLILALIGGGIPAAISKYVSELMVEGREKTAKRTLKVSLVVVLILGSVVAAVVFVFRNEIAALQGNESAGIAYAAITPAIIFSCLIACIRGYFQGHKNLLPSGISQMIEQVVKVVAGLVLAAYFMPRGVAYGVVGALIGVSISEVAAFIYLVARCLLKGKRKKIEAPSLRTSLAEAASDVKHEETMTSQINKATKRTHETDQIKYGLAERTKVSEILKKVYTVALPITLGSLIIPLTQAADSFLIINLLVKSGTEIQTATVLYGVISGPVGSLINMPSVVSIAMATSMLPSVAAKKAQGISALDEVKRNMDILLIIMLPVCFVFIVAPSPILKVLYGRGLDEGQLLVAADLLRIESVNVLFTGVIQLASAAIQGQGKARQPVINLLFGAVAKIAVSVALLPVIGIYGAAIGNVVCYMLTCTADMISARKYCGKILGRRHGKIVLIVGIFALMLCSYNILTLFMYDIIAFAAAFVLAFGVYIVLIIKTKCILLHEILL